MSLLRLDTRGQRAGWPAWRRPLAVGALLAALPLVAIPWRQRVVVEYRPHGRPARLLGREVRVVRRVAPAWAPPRARSGRGTNWSTDTRSDLGAPRVDWLLVGGWSAAAAAAAWAWGGGALARIRLPVTASRGVAT